MKMPLVEFGVAECSKMKRTIDFVYTIIFEVLDFAENFLKTCADDYTIFVSPYGNDAIVRVMDTLGNEVCVRVIEHEDYVILKTVGHPKVWKEISKEELRKKILDIYGERNIDYYG